MKVNEKLKLCRKSKKLTLEQLAKKVGISKSYLWELEKSAEKKPSAQIFAQIALHLGVTTSYLLDEQKAMPSEMDSDLAFYDQYKSLSTQQKATIREIAYLLLKNKTS